MIEFPPTASLAKLALIGIFTQVWPSKANARPVSFSREVRPILSENCLYCHGQDANHRKADLRLDTALGQKDAVKPGDAEGSELVKRLFSQDPEEVMPPPDSNRHVTPEQRELLKRWVAEGATFEDHWTFQPITRPAVPVVPGNESTNPIDAFVAEKHQEKGITFSPAADKTTLLRRLYIDLIGLPPTPEEVDAFVANTRDDAYSSLVEKLLASPHFGERMALPWLDAARFADSNGFQQDGDTHQYVWRDWVVRAYNADMPFDQFSTEQLAGDLLPSPTEEQLVASAFNRNHLLNGEGGAIPEEQRTNILFDRVDTTSTNWLGLTVACAQCHDHKYDPVTTQDYYSLMAFFNNVPESGTPPGGGQYRIADPWIPIAPPEQKAKLQQLKDMLAAAKKTEAEVAKAPETKLAYDASEKELLANVAVAWQVAKPEQMTATNGPALSVLPEDGSIWVEGTLPETSDYVITLPAPANGNLTGLRLETIPDRRLPAKGAGRSDSGNAVLTSLKLKADGKPISLTKAKATYTQKGFSPEGVLDTRDDTAWAIWPDTKTPHTLVLECGQTNPLPKDAKLELTLEFRSVHKFHQLGRFRLSTTESPQPAERMNMPDDIAAIVQKKERTPADMKKVRDHVVKNMPPKALVEARAAAKQADDALRAMQQDLPRVMVMSDAQPRKTKIFDRGNYLNPTVDVAAGSPGFLPSMTPEMPKNRLGLAQWLFTPNNPLTARVQVNRWWQYFFGVGIIKTSEDLGVQSEVPIHNALLDWLSAEFKEQKWSQKQLIRLILNSRTYQQSSRVNRAEWSKDPENRYLSRASRFRMPSMLLRDFALAASGLLNSEIGGKPVYPYQPDAVWETLAITKERDFTYPASKGKDLYRRSLYTFWRRTIGPTNMFDGSARQACKVRATQTSTPLHALTTLNDATWVEAARILAEKALKQSPGDIAAQIRWAFRRVLLRQASEKDMAVLTAAHTKQLANFQATAKAAEEFLSMGEAPRDKALPPNEHAALTAVCLAMFNLDEALTRE